MYTIYMFTKSKTPPSPFPMTFDGSGYTTFGAGSEYDINKTHFSLDLKTSLADCLVIYARADDEDFFSMKIVEGKVIVYFDMGSGIFMAQTNLKVNDGQWHSIAVNRHKKGVILIVDEETTSTVSTTKNISISRPAIVYVGGTNLDDNTPRFAGCIRNLTFSDRNAEDIEFDYSIGGVAKGCRD